VRERKKREKEWEREREEKKETQKKRKRLKEWERGRLIPPPPPKKYIWLFLGSFSYDSPGQKMNEIRKQFFLSITSQLQPYFVQLIGQTDKKIPRQRRFEIAKEK
jgi:hypothetical protein